jgi:hypothetical protein
MGIYLLVSGGIMKAKGAALKAAPLIKLFTVAASE